MTLIDQVVQLQNSISGYDATRRVPWQVAKLVNVLVDLAKQRMPDEPTFSAIDEFQPSSSSDYSSSGDIGTVRAILSQLVALLPPDA